MVGVPGKSQACHSCKRRRVKCDFRRPFCLRCEKAEINCGGYNRDFIFVNQTPKRPCVTATSVLSELKREENYRKLHPNLQYDQDLRYLLSEISNSLYAPLRYRRYAEELLKKLYLPQPHQLARRPELGRATYSWLHAVCQLSGQSQALDYSLLAFSVIQVYITRIGTASLEQALHLYTEGIERLRRDLENPTTRFLDETIAAIVVLSTCELFISPTDYGWRAHTRGLSEILRLRSPAEAPSPMWYNLCSRLRIVCVLEGLTKRQALSLTTIEWREIALPEHPSGFEELIDILVDVPVLFEESDMILHGVNDQLGEIWAKPVLRGCMSVVRKIYALMSRVRAETPGSAPYWAVPSVLHNPADDEAGYKLFPFSLEFDSLHSGILFVLSWSTLVTILSNIMDVYDEVKSDVNDLAPLEKLVESRDSSPSDAEKTVSLRSDWPSKPAIAAEIAKLARLICQCIEFFFRDDMGIIGPQSTTYSQWAIRSYFRSHPGYERELAWCLNIKNMRGPRHRCGLQLMSFQDDQPAIDHTM